MDVHVVLVPEEPIWKNLLAYLVELFQPSFLSPDKLVPLKNPPPAVVIPKEQYA
ncbi:hypothetical protein VP01_1183g2 [Puccinia sorghi]|uniref:Uncharacterized protein n=1 Tax=Puccinia sorghi TaxID=27349 RepID=A0A0L6VR15_9BASI|nr:hypothetical protein VP01_1183g2 [Puccinia sorghi]